MNSPAAAAQAIPAPAAADDQESFNLLELLDAVVEQKWLIGSLTAAGLALGVAGAQLATPIYQASTTLQIESKSDSNLSPMLAGNSNNSTATEIEILRSRSVIGEAVKRLQFDVKASPRYIPYVGKWLARNASSPSKPGFLGMGGYVSGNEALVLGQVEAPADFSGSLTLRLIDGGYLLLSTAGQVLGQGQIGQQLSFDLQGKPASLTVDSATGMPGAEFVLTRLLPIDVTQALQNQLRVAEVRAGTGVITASLEGSDPHQVSRILNAISEVFVQQSVQRRAAEAEKSISFLDNLLPQIRKEVDANEAKLNQFRIQQGSFDLSMESQDLLQEGAAQRLKLVELQQLRKEYDKRYTPEHPAYQALNNKIEELGSQINKLEARARNLPAVEQELLRLERDVKISDGIYTQLLNNYHQLRLTKEGKLGNVRVVDPAIQPPYPSKPNKPGIVGMAGGLGLALGLGLAFLRQRQRSGIRHSDELEHKLGLNVFATIPFSATQKLLAEQLQAKQGGLQLLAVHKPDDAAIESLRSLRTTLQFAMLDAPNNLVVLTGPTPNVGKSFVSTNFAAVLAAAGKRVLLIDADMRKGHIHSFLGLQRGQGLSELVAGSLSLEQVLHREVQPGLDFISTGTLPPNPAELLMSPATSQMLQTLGTQYDIVIIDTPPVLAVSDTAVLAQQAGTLFLLARAETSTLAEVQETVKRLQQAGTRPSGILFNGIDLSKRRYGYGYGYKYGRYQYRYQYRNYEYDNKA